MGAPILKAAEVPVISDNEQVVDEEIEVEGKIYRMTCVSMGNPHAVVFMDDVAHLDIEDVYKRQDAHRPAKEQKEQLRQEVYATMKLRSENNSIERIKYIKSGETND